MLAHYLKLIYRSMLQDKFNSIIYFLVLIVGMSSFFYISIISKQEYDFDKFHKNHSSIYRITTEFQKKGKKVKWALTNGYIRTVLEEQVPEVEMATKFMPNIANAISAPEIDKILVLKESSGLLVDANFLQVLPFTLLDGLVDKVLAEPNSIVITQELAKRIFNSTQIIGKKLKLSGYSDMVITGLLKDIPYTSHLKFDYLICLSVIITMLNLALH
jgi:putative ABC transport system permease protein